MNSVAAKWELERLLHRQEASVSGGVIELHPKEWESGLFAGCTARLRKNDMDLAIFQHGTLLCSLRAPDDFSQLDLHHAFSQFQLQLSRIKVPIDTFYIDAPVTLGVFSVRLHEDLGLPFGTAWPRILESAADLLCRLGSITSVDIQLYDPLADPVSTYGSVSGTSSAPSSQFHAGCFRAIRKFFRT